MKQVFVFGSNEAGVHGAGAARVAYEKHGARWGKGFGHYGDSFAIPTKSPSIETLELNTIRKYVEAFLQYAAAHKDLTFKVTRIGCGLADVQDLLQVLRCDDWFFVQKEQRLLAVGRTFAQSHDFLLCLGAQ